MANARVSQSATELIATGYNVNARLSQSVIEIVDSGVPMPQAACNNPPQGLVGGLYAHTFTAAGGNPPYTFAITAGALPPGLALNGATGVVGGTPVSSGTFIFTLSVTDTTPRTTSVVCSITINAQVNIISGGAFHPCAKRNPWDWCMFAEMVRLQRIKFPPLNSIPQQYRHWLPWDEDFGANAIPPGAVPLNKVGGIVTPAPAAGDQIVLQTRVPFGYDGLLAGIFHFYTGNGFDQGSGDILWRVQINQRYLEDLGNIAFTLGSPQSPCPLTEGQVLLSGQTVRYIVRVPNLSGMIQVGQSQIACGLVGFFWPR